MTIKCKVRFFARHPGHGDRMMPGSFATLEPRLQSPVLIE
jgi:hypothetical protein